MKLRVTKEDFIRRANEIHNFAYDYSICDYTGTNRQVLIICPKHGVFKQKANAHLSGRGCLQCGYDRLSLVDHTRPKTSKYKGVSWIESVKKWDASLYSDKKQHSLGRFDTEEDAHNAVEDARLLYRPVKVIDNLDGEIWVDFNVKNGLYSISNKGRIKSYNWRNTGETRLLTPQINPFGYYVVHLMGKTKFIHNLVANAFLGDKDDYVNHKDGNKLNNDPSNLEYVSNRVNVCHGLVTSGKKEHPIGAHKRKRDGMWVTEIKIGDKRIWLGAYSTAQEASNRYINALKEYGFIEDYDYMVKLLNKSA